MAVVADAGADSPVRVAPGGPIGVPVHRQVRVRPVRLVRAGDGRRPGHRVVAPRHRRPAACVAPRSVPASFGWLVLTGGLVLLIVLGFGWAGSGDNAQTPVPTTTTVVSIHSGETLWDVATSEAPSSSPQEVVDRIRALNGLTDATLYPGELLRVPVETAAR